MKPSASIVGIEVGRQEPDSRCLGWNSGCKREARRLCVMEAMTAGYIVAIAQVDLSRASSLWVFFERGECKVGT